MNAPLRLCRLPGTLLAVCLVATPALGDVLRLSAGTQTVYATPQEAINAASDGDVLLFESGTYPGFVIGGLALTLVALPSADVVIDGAVEVRGLASNESVVLSGLSIHAPSFFNYAPPAVTIRNCVGLVVLQDCILRGNNGCPPDFGESVGLQVTDSLRVAVLSCKLFGASADECYGALGGTQAALTATNSTLLIQDTQAWGGSGYTPTSSAWRGADAVRLHDSTLFAAGGWFRGGNGGLGDPSGAGGDGLYIDSGSSAEVLDVHCLGGIGAPDGLPIRNLGSLFEPSGAARELGSVRLAKETDSLRVHLAGRAGDSVWAPTSMRWGWLPAPNLAGVWLLPYPARMPVDPWVVLPPGGRAGVELAPLPVSSPLGAAAQIVELLVHGDPNGLWLGSVRHMLRLDTAVVSDCDGNGVWDLLDVLAGEGDCNGDWQLDACQIASGALPDCNANGVPDGCDIALGTSADLDSDGIPDECQTHPVWYVDAAAAPGGVGSAGSPFQTLGEAFAAASSGDEIRVAPGTYVGAANRDLEFGGRALFVRGTGGPDATVIDAQWLGRIFLLEHAAPEATRIEGLTLRNGRAYYGGCIEIYYVQYASVELVDCVFDSCQTTTPGEGGGLRAWKCDLLVSGCRFVDNSSYRDGGAIALEQCPNCVVRDTTFEHCGTSYWGGALYAYYSSVSVAQCSFLGNSVGGSAYDHGGGGIYVSNVGQPVTITDCLFAGNSSTYLGGALALSTYGSTPIQVAHCTFHGNQALHGGAVFADNVVVTNSVLWGDVATSGHGNEFAVSDALEVDFSLVQGGLADVDQSSPAVASWPWPEYHNVLWGNGNQDGDPLFVDPDGADNDPLTYGDNDYRLSLGSPALDAGSAALMHSDQLDLDGDGDSLEPLPVDLEGNPRATDVPSAPDVGVGTLQVPDLGCYERQG